MYITLKRSFSSVGCGGTTGSPPARRNGKGDNNSNNNDNSTNTNNGTNNTNTNPNNTNNDTNHNDSNTNIIPPLFAPAILGELPGGPAWRPPSTRPPGAL